MKYELMAHSENGQCAVSENSVRFRAEAPCENAFFSLDITFSEWEQDAYILMPACAYNGNRFRRMHRYGYPPMYELSEIGADAEPVMTDVPALAPDGTGKIEVTSGDMAVPCVGVFYRHAQKGFLLYTEQAVKDKNIGFTVEAGRIVVSFPACRKWAYCWAKPYAQNRDTGISVKQGEMLCPQFKIFTFNCASCDDFFAKFFDTRKSFLADERTPNMYTDDLWEVMECHFNEHNWSGRFYGGTSKVWGSGWCGCGMSSYPLLKDGQAESVRRAEMTLDFMTEHQSAAGFYYNYKNGQIVDDSNGNPLMDTPPHAELSGLHLVRRSGDCLNFICKHFAVKQPKASWLESAKKCANAFVKLFDTYGTFGQYVHCETGDMMVYKSCAGASAIAGLVRASKYFDIPAYLETAEKAGDMYYRKFISQGVTSGAIGDALCVPDSESIFSFIEGYVLLYEATKDEKWLRYARTSVHLASSWVVTYRYKFPAGSEFDRLSINTVGSIFANVQNKHSAPGICTSSGDYIYRLYEYTQDARYLEFLLDIVSFMPQCVSTAENPIYATIEIEGNPIPLPPGYINERVNMSDWEGPETVGEVFNGSCWCETSLLLTFSELIKPYNLTW